MAKRKDVCRLFVIVHQCFICTVNHSATHLQYNFGHNSIFVVNLEDSLSQRNCTYVTEMVFSHLTRYDDHSTRGMPQAIDLPLQLADLAARLSTLMQVLDFLLEQLNPPGSIGKELSESTEQT